MAVNVCRVRSLAHEIRVPLLDPSLTDVYLGNIENIDYDEDGNLVGDVVLQHYTEKDRHKTNSRFIRMLSDWGIIAETSYRNFWEFRPTTSQNLLAPTEKKSFQHYRNRLDVSDQCDGGFPASNPMIDAIFGVLDRKLSFFYGF